MKYQIYNFRTKENIGKPYTCVKKARRRCDKLDLLYGAISYRINTILDEYKKDEEA